MGFTTTCRVGVDLETITVLFQSTVTSFGLLADCASAEPQKQIAATKTARARANLREAADTIAFTRFKVLDGCPMFAPAYMGR
jgi:hypothetical protein